MCKAPMVIQAESQGPNPTEDTVMGSQTTQEDHETGPQQIERRALKDIK